MRYLVWIALLAGTLSAALAAPAEKEAPMTATLRVTPTRARPGEKFELRLTVTNNGQREERLLFRSGQKFDFTVTRDQKVVWRWSHGRAFTMALEQITLKPGESRTFEAVWEQKDNAGKEVPEGEYLVTSVITAHPEIRAAPVKVRVAVAGPK
ncbi:MAG TPA: BsuPI-related putative proteinase inhibitor [Armatimonadota bacterium]|nr:BsuPI-related putative proteinase inhibitor [Armatimonadota bacterium]HOQ27797.1 BsuPI-related putative proteinase inhibitor [Armatimonadota bacterium]HPT99527.1 BsuPI-related putative proteinase inhibitor [Armatimonadota bacterium]